MCIVLMSRLRYSVDLDQGAARNRDCGASVKTPRKDHRLSFYAFDERYFYAAPHQGSKVNVPAKQSMDHNVSVIDNQHKIINKAIFG